MLVLKRLYEVQAAHRLTAGVPDGHPCSRLHGHRYMVTVGITAPLDESGMVLEYALIDRRVWDGVLKEIDHHDLNSLKERDTGEAARRVSQNPTVELLAEWAAQRIQVALGSTAKLVSLRIEEDSESAVEWSP